MDSASNGLSLGTTIDRSVSGHNSTAPDRSLDHDTRQVEPAASGCMVAVIENRAKEVGMAVFDSMSLKLKLVQCIESTRSYVNTLSLLKVHQPSTLIIVGSNQALTSTGINSATRAYHQVPMGRSFFDDTQGAAMIAQYAVKDLQVDLQGMSLSKSFYLAFGAAGALLRTKRTFKYMLLSDAPLLCKAFLYLLQMLSNLRFSGMDNCKPQVQKFDMLYLEQEQHTFFSAHSLAVEFTGTAHHMQIDLTSIEALELIRPATLQNTSKHGGSLYRFMNHTKTSGGARLLRANLLQPLTSLATIRMRQEAVQEFIGNDDLSVNVTQALSILPKDLDKICANIGLRSTAKASGQAAQHISKMVGGLILLKEVLQVLPSLARHLEGADSQLLQAIGANCNHEVFKRILDKTVQLLDEDVQSSKTTFINKTQQCFAVRSGVDGILDLARSTFCRVTEQVHELVDKYKTEHGFDALKVSYTARRGFYLVCPKPGVTDKSGAVNGPLPRAFIQLESRNRHSVDCTSHELNALNSRLKDASNDCMVLTEQVLDATIASIGQDLMHLHKLVDNIALLDMLCALSMVVTRSAEPYCCPICTESGPIAIVEGRHPIIETREDMSYQANDTYMADASSFHIITGPNMAGKSTYLRQLTGRSMPVCKMFGGSYLGTSVLQVALIVVMAQIGSFVPASFVSMHVVDKLFTRIGTSDSIETNSSSFMVEMQETAHIVNHATNRSLVIIDELGRATSTADGVGIALAISEHLIATGQGASGVSAGAATLFATHFTQLAELAGMYPNCKLWHFNVDASPEAKQLDYTWKLKAGQQEAMHYGLILARSVGIPDQVLHEAKRVVARLDKAEKQVQQAHAEDTQRQKVAHLYSLGQKVKCWASIWKQKQGSAELLQHLQALKLEANRAFPHGLGQ